MIGKHTKGKNPYRLVQYLMTKPNAQVLTSNLGSDRPTAIAHELQWGCQLNQRTKRPIYHASLSLMPHERLSDHEWRDLARDYLQAMGLDASPYLVVRHSDRQHDHIHIAASRVRLDNGKCVSDSWDHLRCQTVLRELEQRFGLQPTLSSWEQDRKAPSVGMMRLRDRTGQELTKPKLQILIDQTCENCSTLDELLNNLNQQGIETQLKSTPTGRLGISYHLEGMTFSGSQLGRAYTVHGLEKYRQISHQSSPASKLVHSTDIEDVSRQQQWINQLIPTLQRLVQNPRYQIDEMAAWVEPYWIEWGQDQISVEATDGRGIILQVKLDATQTNHFANLKLSDVQRLRHADDSIGVLPSQHSTKLSHKQTQLEL